MKKPYEKEIIGDLREMQDIVGGTIQAVYPFPEDTVALICNDEGKLLNLPYNRFLYDDQKQPYDVICGTFFVVGLGEEDFKSLTIQQIRTYSDMYSREFILPVPRKEQHDKHDKER